MEEKNKDYLSYSSSTTLSACEQKYVYDKIERVKPDSDYEVSSIAFDIGKIFHKILEENRHELGGVKSEEVKKFFSRIYHEDLGQDVDFSEHGPLIFAMLRRYKELHEKSGLSAVACEIELSDEKFLGYIDVILKDSTGNWFICDVKTSSRFDSSIVARLHKDRQLNLYAYHSSDIADNYGLEVSKYRGCLYRVTTKSKANRKGEESFGDFSKRLYKSVNSYQIVVPAEKMDPVETREEFDRLFEVRRRLISKEIIPNKNFSSCFNYFRPCQFWSRCHNGLYSELAKGLEIVSTEGA